jgi:UDP-glucuronate 4-epimerase
MNILVTGSSGFVGYYVAKYLLERGDSVIGIDNMNDYYDISLKEARLKNLKKYNKFKFIKHDISLGIHLDDDINVICHLAAQAGVRYSIKNPLAY